MLDDIAQDALATAIQYGLGELSTKEYESSHREAEWAATMREYRADARRAIENGNVEYFARKLEFFGVGMTWVRIGLAALASQSGGVRISRIVFCATHYPAGTEARFRLSCPQCSPDDTGLGQLTGRDVVSIEGAL